MLWRIFLHNPTAVLLALVLHIGLAVLLVYKSSTPLTNKDGENKFSIQAKVIDIASIKKHAKKFAKTQEQQDKAPLATQPVTRLAPTEEKVIIKKIKKLEATEQLQTIAQNRAPAALITTTKQQQTIKPQQTIKAAKLQREFMRQQEKAATKAKYKTEIKHQHTKQLSQEPNQTTAINELQHALAIEEQEHETYELATLQSQIYEKIRNNWRIPAHTNTLHCTLRVRINTNGDVLSIQVQNSSGNKLFDASTERAVYRSSPLPIPQNKRLFDEFLVLEFTPNQN